MKNKTFYSVTRGQLIAMIIFGIIGAIFSGNAAGEGGDSFFGLLAVGILFFLVFYIIGWIADKKANN